MADWVLEMESDKGDVDGVGSKVSMLLVDVGEVDEDSEGKKQRETNARIWLGSSGGGGGVFLGWFNPRTKCKNWVFWVVSLDDSRKKIYRA